MVQTHVLTASIEIPQTKQTIYMDETLERTSYKLFGLTVAGREDGRFQVGRDRD